MKRQYPDSDVANHIKKLLINKNICYWDEAESAAWHHLQCAEEAEITGYEQAIARDRGEEYQPDQPD